MSTKINTNSFPFTNMNYEEYLKSRIENGEILAYFNYDEFAGLAYQTSWAYSKDCIIDIAKKFENLHNTDPSVLESLARIITQIVPFSYIKCQGGIREILFLVLDGDDEYFCDDASIWFTIDKNGECWIHVYKEREGYSLERNYFFVDEDTKEYYPLKTITTDSIALSNRVYNSVYSICVNKTLIQRFMLQREIDLEGLYDALKKEKQKITLFNMKENNSFVYDPCAHEEHTSIYAPIDEYTIVDEPANSIAYLYRYAQKTIEITKLSLLRMLDSKQYDKLIYSLKSRGNICKDEENEYRYDDDGERLLCKLLTELGLEDYRFLIDNLYDF